MLEKLKERFRRSIEDRSAVQSFFPREKLSDLRKLNPQVFVDGLGGKELLFQIAGAARDSLQVLGDEKKARGLLLILKKYNRNMNDFGYHGEPKDQAARAVAMLLVNGYAEIEEEIPFLDLCREQGIQITRDDILNAMRGYYTRER